VVAHALNERFVELGGNHPVAYSETNRWAPDYRRPFGVRRTKQGTTLPTNEKDDRVQTYIGVRPLKPGCYEVTATEGLLTTRHQVAVSADVLNNLGLSAVEPTGVVRETFLMLLEREPATSVPAEVNLEAIGNCYADFWSELRQRVLMSSSTASS
jgi:hypothetical protein